MMHCVPECAPFAQIEMLRPGLVGDHDTFGANFCGEKVLLTRNHWDWRCAPRPTMQPERIMHAQAVLCSRCIRKSLQRVLQLSVLSAQCRGSCNEAELNHILRQHLLIRRLKKACHVLHYLFSRSFLHTSKCVPPG